MRTIIPVYINSFLRRNNLCIPHHHIRSQNNSVARNSIDSFLEPVHVFFQLLLSDLPCYKALFLLCYGGRAFHSAYRGGKLESANTTITSRRKLLLAAEWMDEAAV